MIWYVLDIICFVPGEELVQPSVVTKQRVDLKVNVFINSRLVGLQQLLVLVQYQYNRLIRKSSFSIL